MTALREIGLALRLLARDHRAGELLLIGIALVIAVASVTTVGFFADRVQRALDRQADQLLGADLVAVADRPLPAEFEAEAQRNGLAVTRMLRFPSMVMRGDRNVLASVKVVAPGYPLRGEVRIADEPYGADRRPEGIPIPGTVWVDERLFSQLGLALGDVLKLGAADFTVAAILRHEPDTAIGFINTGPRIHVNIADITATGLIQPGSRIRYRLQFAGAPGQIEAYRNWILPRLQPGQRIEGIRDARPEIRAALERAEKFLSLMALVSVVLAAVAVALSARRFLRRHFDGCALMRCLGATQGLVVRLYCVHFVVLGLTASVLGCVFGFVAQFGLAHWLGGLVQVQLPAPTWLPGLHGLATGMALLLGFALPPLSALGKVSTLRVLRRELGVPRGLDIAGYALGFGVIAGLILWKANDFRLGSLVLAGFIAAMAAAGLLVWLLIRLLARFRTGGIAWRFGIANLRRHTLGSILQVVALGVGIMALLTLTVIRGDLLAAWQRSLPEDAPNRFIVNIQPDQLNPLADFFAARGVAQPAVFPMVRGRLVAINGRSVSSADYADDRTRRLIDREFNLSWAEAMQADNLIVAGRWWGRPAVRTDQLSMEEGIAGRLGIRLNDALTFDIAGSRVNATVTSLRKVDWDTFNVNFFAVMPPGLLDGQPVTYITSFYLPPGEVDLLNALVRAFPNLLLIDVEQIMTQVQKMMHQVARAVQFLFLFTLLSGLIVLYAAIAGTMDERFHQATIMRTLGASRSQITLANLAEFAMIGALAGLVAAAGASALGFVLAVQVLNLTYAFNVTVWWVGLACGAAGIATAGHFGTRRVLDVAPLRVLQRVA
jgi:putative ABC transport system permease protein